VGSDGVRDALRVGSQSADVKPPFACGFVADHAFRFEHGEAAQLLPLQRLVEALQLIEDRAAARFQATLVLVHRLGKAVRGVGGGMGAEAAPEVFDRLGQLGLVSLTARTYSAPRS
jgi:hypothetical protein